MRSKAWQFLVTRKSSSPRAWQRVRKAWAGGLLQRCSASTCADKTLPRFRDHAAAGSWGALGVRSRAVCGKPREGHWQCFKLPWSRIQLFVVVPLKNASGRRPALAAAPGLREELMTVAPNTALPPRKLQGAVGALLASGRSWQLRTKCPSRSTKLLTSQLLSSMWASFSDIELSHPSSSTASSGCQFKLAPLQLSTACC